MTWVFQEGDLEISISNAENARKFDAPSDPKPGQMKAVDFIVEYPDSYLFVEFKDPQDPNVPVGQFVSIVQNIQSEGIDTDLIYKYRDSFLNEWAAGRADRISYYVVLIAVDSLTPADLDRRTKDLERKLPAGIPSVWERPVVAGCGVFNLASWNARFPQLQVRRLSVP